MAEKGRPLPKFGEWDVNDPASAEGFTVIFNKARNEKRAGGNSDSPPKDEPAYKPGSTLGKPQSKSHLKYCRVTEEYMLYISLVLLWYPAFSKPERLEAPAPSIPIEEKKWFCCIS